MSNARTRREQILSIVASEAVRTQDELLAALQRRGIEASQASLSRDIAALGLAKVAGRYALPGPREVVDDPLEMRVRNNLLSVEPAGEALVVLKTPAGEASAVALALDRLLLPGVVGTVAGDDTIFVAVSGAASQVRVLAELRAMALAPALAGGR